MLKLCSIDNVYLKKCFVLGVFNIYFLTLAVLRQYIMRQIIKKIKLFCLYTAQSETANQRQGEGLSAVNHPCVIGCVYIQDIFK